MQTPQYASGQQSSCPPPTVGYVTDHYAANSPDAVTFVAVSNSNPVCIGGTLNLYATCAVAGSYSWTGPNGFTSAEQNPVRPDITGADAGQYLVTATYANGCLGYASTTVIVNQSPGITVFPSANPVTSGTMVYFNAAVSNGGTMPSFQWYVNFTPVTGATNANYFYIPANNDAVACMVTTSEGCATTSNPVIMIVSGIPVTTTIQNVSVGPGPPVCYNAYQTIFVSGGGTTFMVQPGGNATMIAGRNILYYPNTRVLLYGYMLGKIAPSGPFCGQKSASIVDAGKGDEEMPRNGDRSFFKVYPNPTEGKFRLELSGKIQTNKVRVEIYGIYGEKVLSEVISRENVHEFSLEEKPAGIYFISIAAGTASEMIKIVKIR